MKILFGTDILLYYLNSSDYIDGIQLLINWIDRIGLKKMVDPSSVAILTNFVPFSKFVKLNDFDLLKETDRPTERIKNVIDQSEIHYTISKDAVKPLLPHLALLDKNIVDYMLTENLLTFQLAKELGIDDRVFGIEEFIEKCSSEYRELDNTKGVIVRTAELGSLSLKDPFFKTFIDEYSNYKQWFHSKANDLVFISEDYNKSLKALLKLKLEGEEEDYSDIYPVLPKAKRLKISSFKVDYTGEKLGERFIRIIFDEAFKANVEEIYVTIYNTSKMRQRLIDLLERWGFNKWGTKKDELVYLRKLEGPKTGNLRKDFPFHSYNEAAYIIALHKTYLSQLLPPTEIRRNFFDYEPSKYGIRKVLVLHESFHKLKTGSILLFYQKTSILEERGIMAVGVVEDSFNTFTSQDSFLNRCRKRSILQNEQLRDCWNKAYGKPVVINFLFIKSFDKHEICNSKINSVGIDTKQLISQVPFKISNKQFRELIKETDYEKCITID